MLIPLLGTIIPLLGTEQSGEETQDKELSKDRKTMLTDVLFVGLVLIAVSIIVLI
jgi:hypothetical protein